MITSGDSLKEEQLSFQMISGGSIPTSPLQLKKWHSRLPIIEKSNITRCTYSACFGAYYDNRCYAVAIWSSPIAQNRFKDGKSILELRRMAICQEAPKNTASRMISIMVKLLKKMFPKVRRLISYQDTSVHSGTIYKASGWVATNRTKFTPWFGVNPTATMQDQAKADKVRWELQV